VRPENSLPYVFAYVQKIYDQTQIALRNLHRPIAIGGDHSMAIGTWSSIADHYRLRGQLGLIWMDAHLDAHTPLTSSSHAWHGMPAAYLLGQVPFDPMGQWLGPLAVLKPENICYLGVRSYESEEAQLVKQLGIRVMDQDEIKERGLMSCLAEALDRVTRHTQAFGLTVDLDAIDPKHAPGVGSPEPDGIDGNELVEVLYGLADHPKFVGLELAEFNPKRDLNQVTSNLVSRIIHSVLGCEKS
jgi:arginase